MAIKTVEPADTGTSFEILYPDSDGAPMGETEIHVNAILRLYDALRHLCRNQEDVYVAADMFLYYEEGNPNAQKAPDVMVIKGVGKHKRRTFKMWEEQAGPCVIIEVTSKSTWVEDMGTKTALYASLGVREYILYYPLREYLDTGMLGFRLAGREYLPIPIQEDGSVVSEELGVWLRPAEDLLEVIDPRTGQVISALEEARQQTAEALLRAETAEAEVARLRAMVEQLRITGGGGEDKNRSSS